MRVISCALAIIACAAAPSYAQSDGAAYVEFGGSALYYSVNAELPVARNRVVRVGGMVLPGFAAGGTASLNQLIGRGNNHLVLGLGVTFGGHYGIDVAAGTATIGFRIARPNGVFVQYALTPLITRQGVHPWSGISIGRNF